MLDNTNQTWYSLRMNVNCYNTCAVFGHREIEITYELKIDLKNTFIDLITNKNVGIFYLGGFGQFDKLCWEIITELKQTHFSHIKRIYVCENEDYINRPHKRPKWLKQEDYEEIIHFSLDFNYWYTRIYYRNIAIIEHSDFALFYIRNTENSGAYKAYKYAIKNKKNIILL
ncbi:MAG: hypothetical protein IJ371_04685 [Clostridia bacterium]|nr:hypothetical protein [Clostridia bacterium]